MKHVFSMVLFSAFLAMINPLQAQKKTGTSTIPVIDYNPTEITKPAKQLFIDVHNLGPGKVTYEAVAGAHAKDLVTEGKYGVEFIRYWVDSAKGTVYCLASAYDTASIIKTHAEAHGLIPDHVYSVSAGSAAAVKGGKNLYLDFHQLGAGKVKASDVAAAHQKDLAVQGKYGVNLINYWVNEKEGVVMCLAEAPDSNSLINTHREAHGLIPNYVQEVKQGQ
jgi:hypothetical protein